MKTRLLSVFLLIVVLLGTFAVPAQGDSCKAVYHVVRAGQNLTQIASYYGVSVQAIVKANNLWNPNVIYVGQVLTIPVPCTPAPPAPSGCTAIHVVKRGEYLKVIATRYGTTVNVLVQLNNIRNPNLIYVGQRLKVPVRCPSPQPTKAPTPAPPTGPWQGQFWDNRFLSGAPKFTRSATLVDFNWGTAGPGGGIAGTNFSARWNRTREFAAGRYRFHVLVDDGVRVWLDNVLIIDQWHDTAPRQYSVESQLSAGTHSLQIDYYQNQGGAQIKFWVDRIDAQAAWKAEFHNNSRLDNVPTVTQHYDAIDFDWGLKAPVPGITADHFSARFTGEFYFVGGKYRFTATADDGIRVYVDDTPIIDQWHATSVRTYTADVDISQGNHRIKVEYFALEQYAVCKVRWAQR
jgi:LysM repeat protein